MGEQVIFNKVSYIRSVLIKCYVMKLIIKEIYVYNSHDNSVD